MFLLVYVRKYPLRFKCFEVKLSSSRCYGASWKLLVSPITSARSTRLGADYSYEDSGSCVSGEEEGGIV